MSPTLRHGSHPTVESLLNASIDHQALPAAVATVGRLCLESAAVGASHRVMIAPRLPHSLQPPVGGIEEVTSMFGSSDW